jgi:hypothetical protein
MNHESSKSLDSVTAKAKEVCSHTVSKRPHYEECSQLTPVVSID